MAVSSTATDYSGLGTGASATYGTGIYANASDQIKVYIDGALQTIGDDYSLSGIGSAGGVDVLGTFTLGSAVYVERVTPITQLVDTQNNETILEDVLDAEFDKLTMIAQELNGKANRAVLVPKGEGGLLLPAAAARAGLYLAFGASGELVLVPGTSTSAAALLAGRRTGQFNVSFTTAGDVVAFGGNSGPNTFARGLMIGGGDPNEGGYGILDHLGGHSTWRDFRPLRNYASLELALNPTMATLQGSVTAGGNTITRLQGSATDTFWIGKKCYFGEARYKVSNVAGDVITVTNVDGSAVAWPSSYTEVFRFCIVYGSGTCDISGTAVTRKTGDPFPIYFTDPSFNFKTGGVSRTVVAVPDTDHATLSAAPGNATDVAFEFWLDINDQFATMRVHGTSIDAENLSVYSRYDGYWIESQYGSFGKHRRITMSTGEVSAGTKWQQVNAYADGRVTLGGPVGRQAVDVAPTTVETVNYVAMSGAPTGVGPSLQARGSDANISFGYDTKGSGAHTFTSNSFGAINFRIYGSNASDYLVVDAVTGQPYLAAEGASADISIRAIPKGAGLFNVVSGGLAFNGTKVVGARDTGWTAMTGSADKATAFATGTVTLAQLAGRVMSLQAALTTHGLIGP